MIGNLNCRPGATEQQVPDAVAEALAALFELGQGTVFGAWRIVASAGGILQPRRCRQHSQHLLRIVLPVGRQVQDTARLQIGYQLIVSSDAGGMQSRSTSTASWQ